MTERTEKLTLSVSEAAEALGICTKQCYDLTHVDGFPAIRIGRRIRVSKDGLREWIRNNEGKRLEVAQ